jgi:hypothetical protein
MGVVTEYLIKLIAKQIDASGIVVWYDPGAHYQGVAESMTIPDAKIVRYQGSFYALRYEVEPLMGTLDPPRLVVYVPLSQRETHHALIELEVAGVVMQPGQQPPTRNTRLSLVARNALKPHMTDEAITTFEKQIEDSKLTLADLENLAERSEGISNGVVSLIFGTGNPQEVALAFVTSDRFNPEIVQKDAATELLAFLRETFDVELPVSKTLAAWRDQLARYVLATDFVNSITGDISPQLASVKIATRPAARDACMALCRIWRLRRDLAQSYAVYANHVEGELGLAKIPFTLEQIVNVETFQATERALHDAVASALLQKADSALVDLARTRQSSFWSECVPDIQAQWALINAAGQVLLEADRIVAALKASSSSVSSIFHAYTAADHPWCLLDTCHRRMERRYYDFSARIDDALEQVLARARHRYMEVGSTLAERFLRRLQTEKFRIDGVLRQVDIFEQKIKPRLAEGKVAYVWVDALRYEMAYELAQSLATDSDLEIQAALGMAPTITEIGMAALLPLEKSSLKLLATDGKLALEIAGMRVKDRKDRLNFLRTHAGVSVFDAKLDELLPKPGKRVRDGITNARLVVITSQEIDMIGEENNIALARRTMDDVLHQLSNAFRVLGQLGVRTIIFTADHGYVFAEELDSDMKIDAPGGNTIDLHRRVWVGYGGTTDPAFLRAHVADLGLASDLDIAVRWNFACFKVRGGAEAYFHGGMSPQELIISVVTVTAKKDASGIQSEIRWTLSLGSQKISTRLCSVQIAGSVAGLFDLIPPKVRVEVRTESRCISYPVSASYGLEEATGDVQIKRDESDPQTIEPNTVALAITDPMQKATVSVHLLDVTSGIELARLEKVEMAIAI